MSHSVQPHRRQPPRLPRPWDSPGKNTGGGCHFLLQSTKVKSESEVAQSCPTFPDPTDCSLPGSSVHGIFQARVLEWGAIAFSCLILHWVNGCSINSCPSESTQQIKLTFNHDSRIEWNCCFEHMANDNYYGFKKKALNSRGKQKHFNIK